MREKFEKHINNNREDAPFLLIIELGSSLAYMLQPPPRAEFVVKVSQLRNELAKEWGLRLPRFYIRENPGIDSQTYRFILFDREVVRKKVPPGKTLVISRREKLNKLGGKIVSDPIYDLPCTWIKSSRTDWFSSQQDYYTASVDEVILEHLEAVLRSHVSEMVTDRAVRKKLQYVNSVDPSLVQKTLKKISLPGLVRVMKNLVSEGIPLTEIDGVVRTLALTEISSRDPDTAAEIVRNVLRDKLHNYAFSDKLLFFVVPDSRIQVWLFKQAGNNKQMPGGDPVVEYLMKELTSLHLSLQNKGFRLGIICSGAVRLVLRRIVEKKLPDVIVLKPEEIDPSHNIKIIKKLRGRGLKLWLSWHWFWLTAARMKKKKIRHSLEVLSLFLRKQSEIEKAAKPDLPPRTDVYPDYYSNRISGIPGKNLPALLSVSKKQKAAIYLMGCSQEKFEKILRNLAPEEIVNLGVEMANLPGDISRVPENGGIFGGQLPALKRSPSEIAHHISFIFKKDEFDLNFSPLQKLAVFLSSLSPRTGDQLYYQLLKDLPRKELEQLMMSEHGKRPPSLQKARRWVIEDFLWFLKGSIQPGVLYTSKHWIGELQRIAVRAPRKMAAALKQLWLSQGALLANFDRFVYNDPKNASFWIRRYITNKRNNEVVMSLEEKAFILLQLLPPELVERVITNLEPPWYRIFHSMPHRRDQIDPEKAGVVLTQFLSHYYSAYEQGSFTRPNMN